MTKKTNHDARSSTTADKALGLRVRQARNGAGLSQAELGAKLGVTFQQVQKYEKGVNRVGAMRLQQIAAATDKPISFFLEEAKYKPNSKGEKVAEFIASREGNTIVELLAAMRPATQTEVLSIVRGLARIEAAEAA